MRTLAMLLWMAWMTLPAFAARKVTVEQLEQMLRREQGESDGRLARRLDGLELTERLNGPTLVAWRAKLPGDKSREALTMLADGTAFVELRAEAGSAASVPEMDAQQQMLALAVDYVKGVQARLPNFVATRQTLHFREDRPVGSNGQTLLIPYQRLHAMGKSQDTLRYRSGRELVDGPAVPGNGLVGQEQGLETHGVFGPMLGIVIADAIRGRLSWSRWEQGASEPEAVFRFSVAKAKSHYEVQFCCFVMDSIGRQDFREYAAYHGEMAVDPITGTVLRLSIIADMDAGAPVTKSDILVEYGQVAIGEKNAICPLRSVSLQVTRRAWTEVEETLLNDVEFTGYRMFGTESRVLTGEEIGNP